MQHPLVIAYHLIWTAYGWWLPNDPRGSTSKSIRNDVLTELGELHYGRKRVQPPGREIRQFYDEARSRLQHDLLTFDQEARLIIGSAFGQVIERDCYTCYACAIMPDHVHILIRKHKYSAEEMIESFKETSRQLLVERGLHAADHPAWSTGPGWSVFLEHPDEVRRTITYIENNPLPLGEPIQMWPFVMKYDGWPLHPGHSPNSPYARRLRDLGRY